MTTPRAGGDSTYDSNGWMNVRIKASDLAAASIDGNGYLNVHVQLDPMLRDISGYLQTHTEADVMSRDGSGYLNTHDQARSVDGSGYTNAHIQADLDSRDPSGFTNVTIQPTATVLDVNGYLNVHVQATPTGMAVQPRSNLVSTESTTPLAASGSVNGTARTPQNYAPFVTVAANADVAGTLYLQMSDDAATSWFTVDSAAVAASGFAELTYRIIQWNANIRYRARYVNGAAAQGHFGLYSNGSSM